MDIPRFKQIFDTLDEEGQKNVISQLSDEELDAVKNFSQSKSEAPSLIETALGSPKWSEYAQGRLQAAKDIITPDFWKQIGTELNPSNWPKPNLRKELTLEEIQNAEEFGKTALANITMSPTTAFSKTAGAMLRPPVTDTVRQTSLEAAGQAGYSVPRSNIKQTFLTNLGERFGGKQAIEATAQIRNQPVTNKLAAKALGLSDDTPITPELLTGIREEAGKAYEAVKKIGTIKADDKYISALENIKTSYSGASKDFPELASENVKKLTEALNKKTMSADGVVEQIKNLRGSAKANQSSAIASERLLGKAQKKAADALDDLMERNIAPTLGRDVAASYRKARQLISKTYAVEKALNPATGNISGTVIGKQLSKGVPLTDELKQIGRFSQGFPRLSREPIGAPASGGLFEPLVYGTAGAAIGGATGGYEGGGFGVLAAGIPIVGKAFARRMMITRPSMRSRFDVINKPVAQRSILGSGLAINSMRQNDGY